MSAYVRECPDPWPNLPNAVEAIVVRAEASLTQIEVYTRLSAGLRRHIAISRRYTALGEQVGP